MDAEAQAIVSTSPEPLPPSVVERIAATHVREERDLEAGRHQEVIARERAAEVERSQTVTMDPGYLDRALRQIHPSKKRGR